MLLFEYARRESLERILIEHRDRRLQKNRTAIQVFVHQVDGAARHFDAVSERLVLRIEPRKRREQGRVDIQDALRKLRYEPTAEQPHVAGQADQIDAVFLK